MTDLKYPRYPVEVTTSGIGNRTRLISNLLKVMTTQTLVKSLRVAYVVGKHDG